eukprot:CAMPEP_0185029832 /NCGR_PEP_ID=MMETSP1103-20130426/16392_1 /TAXON_ID=36769 /ORGANISM="Paraphysomonas bandaiensis, Strain Caron Lab Isolate" /LENGTH=915 /DNA_ID=CAMNT_0027564727 /DNA_START=33 /DNA_END=2780 /DNA_ORIENTATION=-
MEEADQVKPEDIVVENDNEDDEEDEVDKKSAKKDNKKKKKKKGKKDEKKPTGNTTTAAGRAILQLQQQRAEEEARLKAQQEEEERRIREEEERAEAERKAAEELKEKKRKAKQEKKEAQIAAGTYMTKSEKEKAKKAQARLEAMRAAGMLVPPEQKETEAAKPKSTAAMFSNKKKGKKATEPKLEKPPAVPVEPEPEPVAAEEPQVSDEPAQATVEEEVADSWDIMDEDKVQIKVPERTDEEVDELDVERQKEHEKLRLQGIERAKREEEMRIKREEEEREREEMERRQLEAQVRKENSRRRRLEREAAARAARSPDHLRSPISCIMGHVDTGKTKLLDKIRHTNVQEGEAGGITQQIGATQFSRETLNLQTSCLQSIDPFDIRIPGLLMIDTPGHESFTNLRSRGSSLCDIAILVIDLMHGLEPQTIESINMLRRKRTPFIVALNKIDRLYGWKTVPDRSSRIALSEQDENCKQEFEDRLQHTITQLMEQGLNAQLYWKNDDLAQTVSLVPTSAVTGEGVPDLLKMLITLTQNRLEEKLMFMDVIQCTVLEVKVIDGLGHTVDVVLVNGSLREGDTIVVSTLEGPVVTTIRALLTPPPNREMRVKSEYVHHQELQGAIGIKIVAPDIARAVAGTSVLVVRHDLEDDEEDIKEEVQSDLTQVFKALSTENKGVMVHASTLGALEALLQFLRDECTPPIPVCHVNIGPIHKKDVMRANIMNEREMPEFATILAFDVKVDNEAAQMAEELHVRIFSADIIYHLFDQFSAYMSNITAKRRKEAEAVAVFPVVLRIMPQHIFNKKDPMVFGVEVVEGTLKVGTMLTIPSNGFLDVGRVIGIENNRKEVPLAKKGTSVSIKITNEHNPTMTYGRQFDHTHSLYSKISRESIDALKEFFKADVSKEEWQLILKMKKVFNIP